MDNASDSLGFEYNNKASGSPFETFLRYTDEKEKSSEALASILSTVNASSLLDVGAGDGQYLELTLSKVNPSLGIELTLVEPSRDLIKQLSKRFKHHYAMILNSSLDDFSTAEKFDVVLASHLFYHIPKNERQKQLHRLLSFLNPDGLLILVLREQDDAYEFKMSFKPLLFDKNFKALVLDDILTYLSEEELSVARYKVESRLEFPYEKSLDDTISIIEFYLNMPWDKIPDHIQKEILSYLKSKKYLFNLIDGIAVIQKSLD